ncbi:hypothetical protein [Sphingobacterium mizutaii]|uniref:hypothetical protein n=1 Tax=Sphingobacterium mizutaii TaxID=1010 RepID=UPI0028A26E75|nr:hypothetical protein [Sphingobacterium mizutaii]
MKDQEIDKLFSDGLRDQEIIPEASIWQGIEAKLDEEKIVPLRKKNNVYIWMIAACLVLALGFSIKMFLFQENTSVESTPTLAQHEDPMEEVMAKPIAQAPIPVEKEIAEAPTPVASKAENQNNEVLLDQTPRRPAKNLVIAKVENPERENIILPTPALNVVTTIDMDDIDEKPADLVAVEVAPIQPLVNIIEHEEVMYAEAKKEPKKKQTIFTNILNTLSENLNPSNKAVKFSSDEEGTITVDLFNSIAKSRR